MEAMSKHGTETRKHRKATRKTVRREARDVTRTRRGVLPGRLSSPSRRLKGGDPWFRDEVAKHLTSAQIAEAQRLAAHEYLVIEAQKKGYIRDSQRVE